MSRLWVDANVLLRFLPKAPPAMAERSARLMAKAERGEASLYMSPLVLTEVIRVLKFFYRYSMTVIDQVTISLVCASSGIEVESQDLFPLSHWERAGVREAQLLDRVLPPSP